MTALADTFSQFRRGVSSRSPRSRFAPVKITDDLLIVRSDAYELTSDGRMRPSFDVQEPVVTLDEDYYKLLPDFE